MTVTNPGGGNIGRYRLVDNPSNLSVLAADGSNMLQIGAGGNASILFGSLDIFPLGSGFQVREVANGKQGVATLVAGTVTVANTNVTAVSRIFLTSNADGGTPGFLRVSARVVGTSFTITSSNVADTSTVAWEIFEPG